MADKPEGTSLVDAGMNVFSALWSWTEANETWRIAFVVVVFAAVLLVLATSCLSALGKFLEGLFKVIDAIKTSGIPLHFKEETRLKVRNRAQFCSVLSADLAYITKAESWNDQYFTDLEAEVEMEGRYYISPLHRFFGKVSTGLRKEKSLIKAISTSSERAIQLTGEPGSGKSVALRHLANQLAVRAKKSKAKDALVPLYINLREMTVPADSSVTADTIRDFILDNIRRGDSDTTAYVRENWTDYRERGIWFFLFDSFDEIPAVLHAEKGNPATKEYAEAIRMFLEGMGACRGILASREFKGPESLPWMKFRILRLSSKKQQELVANAFLTKPQQRQVLHHLAANKSTLANTPLFLTLLCRYVKESSSAPANDYELLSQQIDRLARRDPTYLQRTYSLTPAELLAGAQRIARLFAEESSLGLAPTIDQVEAVLAKSEVPGGDVPRFVAAMVDAKIARADVPNAAPGDRRFAFAHRRYQETLFVRHLVAHPGYISGYDLLTDPRWREYAVTLLETQPVDALNEMFEAAVELLAEATAKQRRQDALEPLTRHCGYFDWTDEATQMLNLLQEGLVRRVAVIPRSLSAQVEKFLKVRWNTGDSFDRMKVLQVSALLPQATLGAYLEEAFTSGSEKAQNEAFKNTAALVGKIPAAVQRAVLNRLADEILGAKDASALLRVEALTARLPRELGADYVQRRCIFLWKFTRLVSSTASFAWPQIFVDIARNVLDPGKKSKNTATLRTRVALFLSVSTVVYIPLYLSMSLATTGSAGGAAARVDVPFFRDSEAAAAAITGSWIGITAYVASVLAMMVFACFPVLFNFRAVGQPLTLWFFVRTLTSRKLLVESLKAGGIIVFSLFLLIVSVYGVGVVVSFIAREVLGLTVTTPGFFLGFITIALGGITSMLVSELTALRRKRKSIAAFKAQLRQSPRVSMRLLMSAGDWEQFKSWLAVWGESEHSELQDESVEQQIRSISAALQHVKRGGTFPASVAEFLSVVPRQKVLMDCMDGIEKISVRHATKLKLDVSSADRKASEPHDAVAA